MEENDFIVIFKQGRSNMSKAKKIIIFVALLDILVVCGIAAVFWTNHNKQLELKTKKLDVEYGELISKDASDYLKKSVDKKIINKTKVTYTRNPVKGKKYDKVGKYTVKLSYKDEVAKVKVTVKDTTKPKFNNINEFHSIEGVEITWGDYIKAEDLAKVEIDIDASSVNINTEGEYTLKATAKDENGNEQKKDIKVIVNEKPSNMSGHFINVDEQTGIVTVSVVADDGSTISRTNNSTTGNGVSGNGFSGGSSSQNSSNDTTEGTNSSEDNPSQEPPETNDPTEPPATDDPTEPPATDESTEPSVMDESI